MTPIDDKLHIIETNERQFAYMLAGRVIHRPKLSVWMILIPVIFVYFFYQFNRYKQGRSDFADNYLITRKRALNAARVSIEENAAPDLEAVARQAKLPSETLGAYRELLAVLIQHYRDLLQVEGEDMAKLVRSAYRTQTNYLLFCNHLNRAETTLNAALRPHLKDSVEGFNDVVSRIEHFSAEMRRQDAEKFFT